MSEIVENPFEWIMRATDENVHKILVGIGKEWQEHERKYECDSEPPFAHFDENERWKGDLAFPGQDHIRYVKIDGKCACVLEPYRQDMKSIADLVSTCKEHNLTFTIDGESSHFPGCCIRIIITEA